ncbi:MAG: S41 family peptidase, partial [Gammaproteobacteria bacterium]|nr:S41 family peptidase [Gammaproteobacteria bacterium]
TSTSYSKPIQFLEPRLQKIGNSWELIISNFVDPDKISEKDMSDNAIKALVETLEDPYSAYMGEEESETFSDEFDGEIEGIGAFVAIDENEEIVIVAPIKDSPAFNAGIKAGDIIRKVDDFRTEGATLYEVVNRIKGHKGTKVKLTLDRNGRILVIEVVRDVVTIKALEYEVIGRGDIMHIKLLNFNQNATNAFREVVEIITQNPNIKGVILDVRDNPGGLLNTAIEILNFLLPNNSTAVHIKYNFFNFTQYTSGQGELQNYPMVVIVNKGSASASEIVAGALKEYDIATLVGETTFGKGTVQEINYFGDNSSLKITVAEWLTPELHNIQGNGITPDIAVSAGSEGTDNMLDRAVQELNKLIR